MAQMITVVFKKRLDAEQAINDLRKLGYEQNHISVVMTDEARAWHFSDNIQTRAAEGVGVGAGVGSVLGAIIAAFTATGSVAAVAMTGGAAIPIVVGPLAAAFAGAGAGGITGGILGGLLGAGIPEDQARQQAQDIANRGILVGVEADAANEKKVAQIFKADGGANIHSEVVVTAQNELVDETNRLAAP